MPETLLRFKLDAFPDDHFHVVRFKGSEYLSELFEFEILLATKDSGLDLAKALRSRATLSLHPPDKNAKDVLFQGVLATAESLHGSGRFSLYLVTMVPSLQRLAISTNSRVFLDKDLKGVATEVLQDANWTQGQDFELTLKEEHDPWEFVCQYQESDYHFLARRLENEGVFFFFDQGDNGDKCVIADAHVFKDCPGGPVDYAPVPVPAHEEKRLIHEFARKFTSQPGTVAVRDVNYRQNTHHILTQQHVRTGTQAGNTSSAFGELQLFATNVKSEKQGKKLATITAQHLACAREQFRGASHCPDFRPGRVFELRKHDKQEFNAKYLLTEVTHHGHQEGLLARTLGLRVSGVSPEGSGKEQESAYRNVFSAIPDHVVFRPARKTKRPSIHGSLSAFVDAQGSGEYAEIDEHGRYKVILPFDLSGRKDGKASAWIRMCQPYAGDGHGMHLPLHKGCEVALMFHDGDPDRPVIAGALPNPANRSPVSAKTSRQNVFSTAHGNSLTMGDTRDKQHIRLHNADSKTFIRMGADLRPPPEPSSSQAKTMPNLATLEQKTQSPGGSSGSSGGNSSALQEFFDNIAENAEDFGKGISKGAKAVYKWLGKTKRLDPSKSPGKHGLQFDTPDWFATYAGIYSSVITGEYCSITFGSYNTVALGIPLIDKLGAVGLGAGVIGAGTAAGIDKDYGLAPLAAMGVLPAKLKTVVALHVTWNILANTTLHKAKKEINLFQRKVEGAKEEASKSVKRIQASKDYLVGEIINVNEKKAQMELDRSDLRGENDQLVKDIKDLKDEESNCITNKSNLIQTKKTLANQRSTIQANIDRATNESTALNEEIDELYDTYESLRNNVNKLGETKDKLEGLENVTVGAINRIIGEYDAV